MNLSLHQENNKIRQKTRDYARIDPMKNVTVQSRSTPINSSSEVPPINSRLPTIAEDNSKDDRINRTAVLHTHSLTSASNTISPKAILEKAHRRKNIEDFLLFIRILLIRVKKRDPLVYDNSKKVLRQSIAMNRGHPELLRWSIENQLRAIVGEAWNETELALYSKFSS